jgi:hypothetical protein
MITIDKKVLHEVGNNLLAGIIDDKLILVIDTKVNLGPSSSGKMDGVASTGGFMVFPGGLKGNLYIGKKNK